MRAGATRPSLAPLASMTCPATYVVTQADLDNGSFTNTATADSTETGPDTDSETVTFTQTPALSIAKTALPATYSTVGQVINYSFQVTNSGNVTLSGPFTVSDDQATDESCPATASLAPGASITCSASYTITQGDLNAGSVTNIATATNGTVTSPSDSETVTAVQVIDPAVTKSGDPATASIGDTVLFTLVITNNGNTVATNVQVVDPIPSFLTVTDVVSGAAGDGRQQRREHGRPPLRHRRADRCLHRHDHNHRQQLGDTAGRDEQR